MTYTRRVTTIVMTMLSIHAIGQTDTIQQLRTDLLSNGGLCMVKIQGLHATTDLLGRPSEMRIVDGAVSRGAGAVLHGKQDFAIAAGQTVRVLDVQSSTDAKKDELKIRLSAGNLLVPVAFVLPQGSLATMTEPQLETFVEAVLVPKASAAPPPLPQQKVQTQQQAQSVQPGLVGSQTFDPATAPNLNIPAVAALSKRCKMGNGSVMMKTNDFSGMTNTALSRENIIIDGKFQQPPPGFFHGMRMITLHPGQIAKLMDVRALTDGEHDILHLLAGTNFPVFTNISFVFPKGTLANMSEAEMEKLIAPWIALPGTFSMPPPENDSLNN